MNALKTLQAKFILGIFPVVIIVTALVATILGVQDYRRMSEAQTAKQRALPEVYSVALAALSEHFEPERIWRIVRSLSLDPDVASATVVDGKDSVIAHIDVVPLDASENRTVVEQLIIDDSKPGQLRVAGKIKFVFHDRTLNKLVVGGVIRTVALVLSLVAAIVLAAVVANRIIIGRPLERLLLAIRRADQEHVREPVAWSSADEIGQVISAYNAMLQKLNSEERVVEERTRELATANAELTEKSLQLELASQHKSDFLASMSHELRTPLNAILGFNELALDEVYGPVPQDMKEPLGNIQTSGKHLLRLINNVLDLAKIEAGRMELALSDYSAQDLVASVCSTLRPLATDKGLEFVATVPAEIPLAYGDPGRIMQCLMNLAGNSLKFTKSGKVEISVGLQDGKLSFRVADSGIGIPPDKIGSLFTEFKQTDATIAEEYGGSGLGLSITRKFIEMHGGQIWVESEPGVGSRFIFEIPLRVAQGVQA